VAGFWVVVDKTYGFVAKHGILSYVHGSFVGDHSGSDFPLVTQFFLYLNYSLQVRNIDGLSANKNGVPHSQPTYR